MGKRSKTWVAVALLLTTASAAWAGTAFFKYERPCRGFYKICVYDYLGEEVAITVRCVELCPITIEWESEPGKTLADPKREVRDGLV